MDNHFVKTRCSVCYRHFCCTSHRDEHSLKNHSQILSKQRQDFLVKMFQKRAERILLNAQKYKRRVEEDHTHEKNTKSYIEEKTDIQQQFTGTGMNVRRVGVKRLYSEINRRIFGTSISVVTEARQILVPIHRMSKYNPSALEVIKSKPLVEIQKYSPFQVAVGKTSTPIVKSVAIETGILQDSWNISQTSSINYLTPPSNIGETLFKSTEPHSVKSAVSKSVPLLTPLRGIISKTSKYEYDSDVAVSPHRSTISSTRRVTFSFGSQVSSTTSSPLESVPEVGVEVIEEVQNSNNVIIESPNILDGCVEAKPEIEELEEDPDSIPSPKTGFLSCVTSFLNSAVHYKIPNFGSWRVSQNDKIKSSKRSRSPDEKAVENTSPTYVVQSPEHKRRCYPCGLRENPIRARKPISRV